MSAGVVPEYMLAESDPIRIYLFPNGAIAISESRDLPEGSQIVVLTKGQIPWLRKVLASIEDKP